MRKLILLKKPRKI